jgi:hypothetical protein
VKAEYVQQLRDPENAKLLPALRSVTGKQQPNPDLEAVREQVTPPNLTQGEKVAQQVYTFGGDGPINGALRKGEPVPEHLQAVHEKLESAFAKAPILKQPVSVLRGMDLPPEHLASFLHAALASKETGEPLAMAGYTSTATGAKMAPGFKGNIEVRIAAVHGLDMMPVSHFPQERELLLGNNSQFRVAKVEKTSKGKYIIHMEQVPPTEHSSKAVRQDQHKGKAVPQVEPQKLSFLGKIRAAVGLGESHARDAGRGSLEEVR